MPNLFQWYFDPVTYECVAFRYQGCGGNANRFNTVNECWTKCKMRKAIFYWLKCAKTKLSVGTTIFRASGKQNWTNMRRILLCYHWLLNLCIHIYIYGLQPTPVLARVSQLRLRARMERWLRAVRPKNARRVINAAWAHFSALAAKQKLRVSFI